jgi:hypothetical protein
MWFPNGPVNFGENGSLVGVILKQRPQASPKLWLEPNASSLTAAVNPEVKFWPHAAQGHRAQHGLRRRGVNYEEKLARSLQGASTQSSADVKDAWPLGFCTQSPHLFLLLLAAPSSQPRCTMPFGEATTRVERGTKMIARAREDFIVEGADSDGVGGSFDPLYLFMPVVRGAVS